MKLHSLSFLVLSSLLAAQSVKPGSLPMRAFLPDDHRLVAHVDLAAMRARGVWEELQVSALNLAFQQMAKELGFPLEALDRATIAGDLPTDDSGNRRGPRSVFALEGNTELTLSERLRQRPPETIGNHEVRRGSHDLSVTIDGKLRIEGDPELVESALTGRPRAGLPCADILSLLSGRADQLAYVVMDVGNEHTDDVLKQLFKDPTWPEGDAPTFLCLRLLVLGDADDPHLGLEVVLRHAKAGEGLATSEQLADAFLATLADDVRLRPLKPILAKVEKRRDHADLVYRADFGRARVAVGHVATLILPMFASARVQEVRVAAPAQPAPEQPKK